MEKGIICVWDIWGIAYECFGLQEREKEWDLDMSVQKREADRNAEYQMKLSTDPHYSVCHCHVQKSHNSHTLLIFAALSTDLKQTNPFKSSQRHHVPR